LAGLVKKNSIILVDFINQMRREGMGLEEAVLYAGPVRLRPIIMTTLATVVGAVPLAFGLGAGAETRAPRGRSIIGGSVLSTAVTLIIVPVLYVVFDRLGTLIVGMTRRDEPPSAPAEAIVPSEVELRPQPRGLEPAISVQPETAS